MSTNPYNVKTGDRVIVLKGNNPTLTVTHNKVNYTGIILGLIALYGPIWMVPIEHYTSTAFTIGAWTCVFLLSLCLLWAGYKMSNKQ